MVVKITSKRQLTFPARELEALGVGPGGRIELSEGPDGFILKPGHVDRSRLGRCTPGFRGHIHHSISRRSGRHHMTRRFGIDTSVLVRLLTGHPEAEFERPIADGYTREGPEVLKLDQQMAGLADLRRL